jgi:hypothetical protein
MQVVQSPHCIAHIALAPRDWSLFSGAGYMPAPCSLYCHPERSRGINAERFA